MFDLICDIRVNPRLIQFLILNTKVRENQEQSRLVENHEKTHGSRVRHYSRSADLLGCALVGLKILAAQIGQVVVWVEIDRWLADGCEA